MRRRRFILLIFLALIAYCGLQLWDIHRVGFQKSDDRADCAIVLGAAAWHKKPSPVLRERVNHAIDLYRSGEVKAIILTGGYGEGADYSESEVAMNYCIKQGVPREHLRAEDKSSYTIDNLREAKKILEQEGWDDALLVSDPWHLKRARKMARDLGLDVSTSATMSTKFESNGARAKFLLKEFLLYHYYLISGK